MNVGRNRTSLYSIFNNTLHCHFIKQYLFSYRLQFLKKKISFHGIKHYNSVLFEFGIILIIGIYKNQGKHP